MSRRSPFDDIAVRGTSSGIDSIMTVCEGNICRSPLAEQLLRREISPRITVTSSGLRALSGAPMDDRMAAISRSYGANPGKHVGTQIDGEHVRSADVILTMTGHQRSTLVQQYPRALRATFTLVEFRKLLQRWVDVEDHRELTVSALVELRGQVQLGEADDVQDPYRRSSNIMAAVGEQIWAEVQGIAKSLRAAS